MLTAIRAGNRLAAAARYAGINPKTVNEWMRRGRGVDGRPAVEPFVGFVQAVERAEAEAEVRAVATIRRAMPRSPRWAAWWLERMHPEWRRPRDRGEAAETVMPPVQEQNFIHVDGDTLRRLATERVRAERGEADIDDATLNRRARLVSGSP